jgi:hypothetical protein
VSTPQARIAFAQEPSPTGIQKNSGSLNDSRQAAQLVQAMAGFGGSSAADTLSTVALGTDTSQQPSLTTPQHV